MTLLSVGACIDIVWRIAYFNLQKFAYRIISRTLFSSTYSTQRGGLLLTFHNGNSAQKSLVGNQNNSQKIANFGLINMAILSSCACIDIV